jgi:hypothetical protein
VRARSCVFPGCSWVCEFFGASAVLDKAEQAQQEAAQHFLSAFGVSSTNGGGSQAVGTTGNERIVLK